MYFSKAAFCLVLGSVLGTMTTAYCEDLTPAELWQNVLLEYKMQDWLSWWQKSPVDAFISPVVVSPTGGSGTVTHTGSHMTMVESDLRTVDADTYWYPDVAPESTPSVHLATWQNPVPQPTQCSGVCVSFSGQGAAALKALTGKRIKGFQLMQATTCADHDAKFGAGRIIQTANALGIQTLSAKAGSAVVQQTIDTNWRKLLVLGLEIGTSVALGVTTSGVVASSKSITTGIALGHLALDNLPTLLKPGTPNPDPFLNSVLDENAQVSLPAGSCVGAMFAGTWEKGSVHVTGRVQLMP